MKNLCRILLTGLALPILLFRLVFAYLDPGSGSMLLQLLLGGLAGLLVILKIYWKNILAFLGIRKDAAEEGQVKEDDETESAR